MIARIIKGLTGRTYAIRREDFGYVIDKGGIPLVRGALWSWLRLRGSRGLALGPAIQFIQSGRLHHGRGVAIGGFGYVDCSAAEGIVLGDKVTLRERAWIQGRSGLNEPAVGLRIGARTYIGPNAVIGIGGPIVIGEDVQIGANLTITAEAHGPDDTGSYVTGHVERRGVTIGDRCWLGGNVSILDGVTIGDGCVIGANSLVTRDIPGGSVAYGVPAKVARQVAPPTVP